MAATLKEDVVRIGRGPRRVALRHLLVVAQVALSVLALVGAGLFLRSLWQAHRADPGFNSDGVVLASFDPFLSGYDESRGREFYRRLVEHVAALPGMQSVSLARRLPLTLSGIAFANVTIEGHMPGREEDMRTNYETVGPNYRLHEKVFPRASHEAARRREGAKEGQRDRENRACPPSLFLSVALSLFLSFFVSLRVARVEEKFFFLTSIFPGAAGDESGPADRAEK